MPWQEAARIAERVLDQGFAVDETEPLLHLERGDVHSFFTLDYRTAEACFETGICLDPLSPYARWFYSGLARVGLMRGELDMALEHLNRATRIYDADGRVYAEYASVLHFADLHQQAIEVANLGLTLLRKGPEHGLLLARKVQSYLALGKPELAEHVARTAFSDLTRPFKSFIHALLGHEQEARQLLPKIRSPFALAWIHSALGDKDQAFSSLREAIDDRIGYTIMFLRLDPTYKCLRENSRWDQLIRYLEEQERSSATASG